MSDKESSLLQAAADGCAADVRAGADINAKNPGGWTALHHAAWRGRVEVARILLAAGADPKATDSDGWTALHFAAGIGRTDIVSRLLEAGADPEAKTSKGNTARDLAMENSQPDVTGLLDAWMQQRVLLDLTPTPQEMEAGPEMGMGL